MSGLLAHRVDGAGEAVLLLNGGLMSIGAWDPVAQPLQEGFRVIRCDLRGQLLSPGTPPDTIDGHVRDVAALLDHLGLPRVHAVGTSYGAFVGLVLAAREPQRVRSLVAVTAADALSPEMLESTRLLREACQQAAGGGDGGRVLDLLVPSTFSTAYRVASAATLALRRRQVAGLPAAWFAGLDGLLAALERLDLGPDLPRIACPTLVVAAGQDATFPPACSHALAAAIRGARLIVVPGSGHALVVEQPQRLVEILRGFLAAARAESEVAS